MIDIVFVFPSTVFNFGVNDEILAENCEFL